MINQPITIKNKTLKTRLIMPPMATSKSNDGYVSQELLDYYHEKSANPHFSLIITEHSYIHPQGKASINQLSIASDDTIEGLKQLVEVIHQNDTLVLAQINHAGGKTSTKITNQPLLSASAIETPKSTATTLPEAMTTSQIHQVIDDFIQAALRAKKAGYDGVEIHMAHGYLLNQFYSPLTNHRNDEYTGSTIEGRIHLPLQIIQAIKEKVDPDFIIALRLGACDYQEGGTTIQDSIQVAIAFEKAGIDLLDISGGMCGYMNPTNKDQGYFKEITSAIKEHIQIPVILTGGILDLEHADELLKTNQADLIGIGRAFFKNSNWPK